MGSRGRVALLRRSILTDHRLVSANDQELRYDVELSIISQNGICTNLSCFPPRLKSKMVERKFFLRNNVDAQHILIYNILMSGFKIK